MARYKKTITAPLATIEIGGFVIGKMKSIRLTETIGRGTVRGLGRLTPAEVPPTTWDGTLTCSEYLIDMKYALNTLDNYQTAGGTILQRVVQSVAEFVDTILLDEDGITINVMRKVKVSRDPATGIITPDVEIFASIQSCFITREGMDITEGQIGGRDTDFVYTTPVIFSP